MNPSAVSEGQGSGCVCAAIGYERWVGVRTGARHSDGR